MSVKKSGGSGPSGSGANGRVALWNGSNSLGSDSAILWDGTAHGLGAAVFSADGTLGTPGITFNGGSGAINLGDGAGHTILQTNGAGQITSAYMYITTGSYFRSDAAYPSGTAFYAPNGGAFQSGSGAFPMHMLSGATDSGTALGFRLNTVNALGTAGAKLLSLLNNSVEKFSIDKDGGFTGAGASSIGGHNFTCNAVVSVNTNSVAISAANAGVGADLTGAITMGAGVTNSTHASTAIGQINIQSTPVGTGADTTEDTLMTFSLPANSLDVNNRAIRVTAWGDGVNTADATTVRCYFGATAVVTKVLTASQANTWRTVYEIVRTGATAQVATGQLTNGGTAVSQVQSNASPAETCSGAITIKCTGQRATSSVANSVRQLGMIIEFFN